MRNANLVSAIFLAGILFSCKKDMQYDQNTKKHQGVSMNKKSDPVFAYNEMVMYWNQNVATVLTAPMNQPTKARLFAIMEIAIHDALNSIKPKFQRYALLNLREQFASPDGAVASQITN